MKPSDQRKITKLEEDLQEYYNWWFMHWYDGDYDDYLAYRPSHWDDWIEYQNDPVRLRQEKIEELFDLNGKPILKDIWPKQ